MLNPVPPAVALPLQPAVPTPRRGSARRSTAGPVWHRGSPGALGHTLNEFHDLLSPNMLKNWAFLKYQLVRIRSL